MRLGFDGVHRFRECSAVGPDLEKVKHTREYLGASLDTLNHYIYTEAIVDKGIKCDGKDADLLKCTCNIYVFELFYPGVLL